MNHQPKIAADFLVREGLAIMTSAGRFLSVILALATITASSSHFDVSIPYPGEIFDAEDTQFVFSLVGGMPEGGEIVVWINGVVATRTRSQDNAMKVPNLPSGLHTMNLQLLNPDGADSGVGFGTEFEVTNFARPEEIAPLPDQARGIRSDQLPIEQGRDFSRFSEALQGMLHSHQHPDKGLCGQSPYLIWEPWGIVGFGAQLLGLRVGLSLGLQTGRVVVGNAEWEDNLVNSELKWRFNLTHSDQGSPWGTGGALQPLSWCAGHHSVDESVRALEGVDMHDHTMANVRVSGDLWGVENRDRIFEMPQKAVDMLGGEAPNLFWWWTESTHYLHRPSDSLGEFIESQKQRMGWKHPIIGIHMRLGVDKNREAQRFPNKYYIHEARRIRRLFGDVGTIFICSDRKHAINRMIDQYGDEFEFLVQPRVQGALPMHYVHTDLALLGQADYLIMTVSSNFGMAALYLNSWLHSHRPTYISMDDLFEGFRYYGYQMTLTYNPLIGTSDLGIRNCAPQIGYRGRTLLHIEDKSIEAQEVCEQVMGTELCLSPKRVVDRGSGEILWENSECQQADDYDGCWSMLFERYRSMLSESESLQSKGDCEEECDDHGCKSLEEGNRRVLGFGWTPPHSEL